MRAPLQVMMRYLRGDGQHTPALTAWLGLQGDEQRLLGDMGSRDSPVSKDRERRCHGKRAQGSGQVPGMGGGGAQVRRERGLSQEQPRGHPRRLSEQTWIPPTALKQGTLVLGHCGEAREWRGHRQVSYEL